MHTVETLGYDREKMFPFYHQAIERGEPLLVSAGQHEAAQDRVCMRRHIRRKHGDVAGHLDLASMDGEALSALIVALEGETS